MKNQNLRDAFSSLKMNVEEIETLSDPSILSSIKGGDCGTYCKKMGNTNTTTVSPPISIGLG